jgi:hypothetical protein
MDERVAWIAYDSGYWHGHCNGMNLGLFAKGRDLMPDFGYPPVQYGGWGSVHFNWYKGSSSHNTVVVDRKNHETKRDEVVAGKCTLWANGKGFNIARLSGPELINGKQFERTVCTIGISEKDSYIIDIFRVSGGLEHVRYMHGSIGNIKTTGMNNAAASDDFKDNQFLRNVVKDSTPDIGWTADWKIEYDPAQTGADRDIHMKYTDLTYNAEAYTCEAWICLNGYNHSDDAWIPKIMTRRISSEEQPVTTFAGVIEPYENNSNISAIRRLKLYYEDGTELPDTDAAIEITLKDGRRDLIISIDTEDVEGKKSSRAGSAVIQKDWNLSFTGEFGIFRSSKGAVSIIYQ